MGAFGALLLKFGSKKFSFSIKGTIFNYPLLGGFLIYILASLVFIFALKLGELTFVYPFTSLTYIWVFFLSSKYLNEKHSTKKWGGIILILIGIVLLSL